MKLASLRDGTRDGTLVVVCKRGDRCQRVPQAAKTLQLALDDWDRVAPMLEAVAHSLEEDRAQGEALHVKELLAPLPRAYEWIDASAFLSHVGLVRRARGATMPDSFRTDPLVYQGGSGVLLAPTAPILTPHADAGTDFEAEVCIVLGDTPMGITRDEAGRCIRLFVIANDVTHRNLIPAELAKGFGFFHSKPATAFSPFAVTPDELGDAFRDGRLHARLNTWLNGEHVGDPDAGEMHFSFFELLEHVAKTRSLTAGTILGSGTVSNEDAARGVSCLVERRALETMSYGAPRTRYLLPQDRVRIEMFGQDGTSIFGAIDQEVESS